MKIKLPSSTPRLAQYFDAISEAEHAIAEVTAAVPNLSANGMNHPCDNELSPEQVATAIAFLRQCRKAKTADCGSYRLKHQIERWGGCVGLSPYVSNGAAMVAAIWCGFGVQWNGRHINVDIAVSRKDAQRLDRDWECREVRP
jgi:hypothetical protein